MKASDLTSRRCQACARGTPPIPEDQARELQEALDPEWKRDGNKTLTREFAFKNFREPFGLATNVALLAESEGHHPDLEIGWGRLRISLTTHVAKGLTENDFIMAAKIDRLVRRRNGSE